MVPHVERQAMNIDSSALSRRPLPTRAYLFHWAPHLCGVPGGVPVEWADVCGFIKPAGSEAECHIRMHGAFKIPYDALGIRCTDQSCHHEVWVHLLCGTRRTGKTARGKWKKKERWLNVHVPSWEQVRTGASEDLCEI